MREIVQLDYCDPCNLEDIPVRTPAKRTARFNVGDGVRLVDVCDVHDKELVEPMERLIKLARRSDAGKVAKMRAGAVAPAVGDNIAPAWVRADAGSHTCPKCEKVVSGKRQNLLSHLQSRAHGLSIAEASHLYPPFGPSAECEYGCGLLMTDSPPARNAHNRIVHPKVK